MSGLNELLTELQWITIQGAHVAIDDDGNVVKGPKDVKTISKGRSPARRKMHARQVAAKGKGEAKGSSKPMTKPEKKLWDKIASAVKGSGKAFHQMGPVHLSRSEAKVAANLEARGFGKLGGSRRAGPTFHMSQEGVDAAKKTKVKAKKKGPAVKLSKPQDKLMRELVGVGFGTDPKKAVMPIPNKHRDTVFGMVDKGLVSIVPGSGGGPSFEIRMTSKGRDMVKQFQEGTTSSLNDLLNELREECESLGETCC